MQRAAAMQCPCMPQSHQAHPLALAGNSRPEKQQQQQPHGSPPSRHAAPPPAAGAKAAAIQSSSKPAARTRTTSSRKAAAGCPQARGRSIMPRAPRAHGMAMWKRLSPTCGGEDPGAAAVSSEQAGPGGREEKQATGASSTAERGLAAAGAGPMAVAAGLSSSDQLTTWEERLQGPRKPAWSLVMDAKLPGAAHPLRVDGVPQVHQAGTPKRQRRQQHGARARLCALRARRGVARPPRAPAAARQGRPDIQGAVRVGGVARPCAAAAAAAGGGDQGSRRRLHAPTEQPMDDQRRKHDESIPPQVVQDTPQARIHHNWAARHLHQHPPADAVRGGGRGGRRRRRR